MNRNKTVVAFGEIMLRLTPPDKKMIYETRAFDACYGGTESNVLVCLSGLGNKTEYLTAIPQNELGNAVVKHLKSYGVGTENIIRSGDTLGMYFLEEGFGVRSANVVYNRRHSEISKLEKGAFDYDKVFENCDIFHISGISFALSENTKELCFEMLEEAKKRGIKTSFDFNYRSKLWSVTEAKAVYEKIIDYIDIVFCSERDLKTFLDIDKESFYERFNNEYLVVREREMLSDGKQKACVCVYHNKEGKISTVKACSGAFEVLERIGSGDAFAAGVLHSLKNDSEDIQKAAEFGIASFVFKHTVKGDVMSADEKTINSYLNNVSKDVSR